MRSSTFVRVALCTVLACSLAVGVSPGVAVATGSSWHWLSPLPRGETLNAVDLVTADIGYAVGNMGCLMKTYDGGANWIEKNSTTTEDLHAVAFIDADTGWVGGDNGFIAKTDGSSGATWTRQVTGITDGSIVALQFRDANRGWAADIGGNILRTTDGGTTWQTSSVANADFNSVYFVSDTVGYATTQMQHKLYKSVDGGIIWNEIHDFGAPITDVVFKPGSTQIGWVTVWQDGTTASAYRTADGGATWAEQHIGGPNAYLEAASYSADGSTLWMIGGNSQPRRIYKVTDSATPAVTERQYAPDYQDLTLNDVDCTTAEHVLAVGTHSTIAHSADGVTFADRARVLPATEINDIQFLDQRTGYLVGGSGGVYKSTSAGKSWAATPTGATGPMYGLCFLDRNTGWAVGDGGRILKTVNGGASWTAQTSGTTATLRSVCFVDANNGWAAGGGGTMLATTNGGTTWTPQGVGTFTPSDLYDVDFYNASEGAAVGFDRVIYTTTNGGATWTPRTYGAVVGIAWYDVEYVAPQTFFVAGNWHELPTVPFSMLKTTTGGEGGFLPAPAIQSQGSDWQYHGNVYDMEFLDASNGWVSFMDGTVARTTNGGTTWTYEQVADEQITTLDVLNANAIWAGEIMGRLQSNYAYSSTTVYRFYRPSTGTHFYTADVTEKHYIINNLSAVYTYEGTGYQYDSYYTDRPLYRFFRPSTGTHFFTADEAEKNNVIATLGGTYTYEGPVYTISGTPPSGVPYLTVYRFYRPKSGTHFYTADEDERNTVIATLGAIYTYEGPVYYLPQ